jgi:hypothetical protein
VVWHEERKERTRGGGVGGGEEKDRAKRVMLYAEYIYVIKLVTTQSKARIKLRKSTGSIVPKRNPIGMMVQEINTCRFRTIADSTLAVIASIKFCASPTRASQWVSTKTNRAMLMDKTTASEV